MKDANLIERLEDWDGNHTDHLIEICQSNKNNQTFVDDILRLYWNYPHLQTATSWIIKNYVDNGTALTKNQTDKVLSRVDLLKQWEAQLHILQLIPKFNISTEMAHYLEPYVSDMINSENKFVKASAYEAYYEIMKLYPEIREEFRLLGEEALLRESASVKVRKILKWFESDANSDDGE